MAQMEVLYLLLATSQNVMSHELDGCTETSVDVVEMVGLDHWTAQMEVLYLLSATSQNATSHGPIGHTDAFDDVAEIVGLNYWMTQMGVLYLLSETSQNAMSYGPVDPPLRREFDHRLGSSCRLFLAFWLGPGRWPDPKLV